ncbi:MAG: hypothetical protein HWQ38_17070 [Nostoc sp. NMS7]|nr:hypothetical protein [Nostoc sp. NMS7]
MSGCLYTLSLNIKHKKLHPQGDGFFGHGEWGIGHGEEVTNALCPKRRGSNLVHPLKGVEFPAAFNE